MNTSTRATFGRTGASSVISVPSHWAMRVDRARSGIALLDINMPGMDGSPLLDDYETFETNDVGLAGFAPHAAAVTHEPYWTAGLDGYG